MKTMMVYARDIQPGDLLRTTDGDWVKTGGIQPLGEDGTKVGILSPEGLISAPADGLVVVRRGEV